MVRHYLQIKLNKEYSNGDLTIYDENYKQIGFVKQPFVDIYEIIDFYFDRWERCEIINQYNEMLTDKQIKELNDL